MSNRKKLASASLATALAAFVFAHVSYPLWADDDHHGRGHREHHDDRDHDRALSAVQRGEVLPLEKVLESLRATNAGTVVGVKLIQDEGKWLYKMKVISRDGRLRRVTLDAKTGVVLSDKED